MDRPIPERPAVTGDRAATAAYVPRSAWRLAMQAASKTKKPRNSRGFSFLQWLRGDGYKGADVGFKHHALAVFLDGAMSRSLAVVFPQFSRGNMQERRLFTPLSNYPRTAWSMNYFFRSVRQMFTSLVGWRFDGDADAHRTRFKMENGADCIEAVAASGENLAGCPLSSARRNGTMRGTGIPRVPADVHWFVLARR